jgi:hypothetical protein
MHFFDTLKHKITPKNEGSMYDMLIPAYARIGIFISQKSNLS